MTCSSSCSCRTTRRTKRGPCATSTGGHVDGVILVSLHGDDPLPDELAARRVPFVVVGRPPRGTEVDYVDADNRGGRASLRPVTSSTAVGGASPRSPARPTWSPGIDRLGRLSRCPRPTRPSPRTTTLVAVGDFTHDSGAGAMEQLLARRPDLDAVFCASDLMAVGRSRRAPGAGRHVPDDVAIVGYDDSPVATTTRPPLTSIRQPIEEMGREMVHLLGESMERWRPRSPAASILATELIQRASSAGRRMP